MNREYNSTATRAKSCYSDLYEYGADGMFSTISIPVPVTVQPNLFMLARPHKMPTSNKPTQIVVRCGQYAKANQYQC